MVIILDSEYKFFTYEFVARPNLHFLSFSPAFHNLPTNSGQRVMQVLILYPNHKSKMATLCLVI